MENDKILPNITFRLQMRANIEKEKNNQYNVNTNSDIEKSKKEQRRVKNMFLPVNLESLVGVHTHTHTHTQVVLKEKV